MKTLILYATKHGATADIAGRIALEFDGAALHNLKQGPAPSLADFARVIIGSSIYAGSIRKEAKEYAAKNAAELAKKELGIFLSCFAENDENFTKNFPAELLAAAKAKASVGGAFDPSKAKGIEHFIVKIVMKEKGHINQVQDEKITQFIKAME